MKDEWKSVPLGFCDFVIERKDEKRHTKFLNSANQKFHCTDTNAVQRRIEDGRGLILFKKKIFVVFVISGIPMNFNVLVSLASYLREFCISFPILQDFESLFLPPF